MTSTTIWIAGSSRISSGLVVINALGMMAARGLVRSRTRIFLSFSGRPIFLEMTSACSTRVAATPPPTTPRPINPTLISDPELTVGYPDLGEPGGYGGR